MTNSFKDLITGFIFILGIVGFLTGDFIISSALFAVSTYVSTTSMSS